MIVRKRKNLGERFLHNASLQGDHSFRKIIFHDFPGPTEMNFQDLSALHFSRNKRNMIYECIPELVLTVPAGCSSENCLHTDCSHSLQNFSAQL